MSDSRPNIFFRYVLISTSIFVITILSLVAGILGDGQAPIHKWLDRNGMTLIKYEVIAIGVCGFLALTIDRLRTLRELKTKAASDGPEKKAS